MKLCMRLLIDLGQVRIKSLLRSIKAARAIVSTSGYDRSMLQSDKHQNERRLFMQPIEIRMQDIEHTQAVHTQALQSLVNMVTAMNRDLSQVQLQVNAIDRRTLAIEMKIEGLQADVTTLKTDIREARADIASLKAIQSDHGEMLKQHGDMLRQILDRLP